MMGLLVGTVCHGKTYQAYEGQRQTTEEAVLILPSDIAVVSVDGAEIRNRGRLMGAAYKDLLLLPGTYQIELRYEDLWDHDQGDDYEKLKSELITVTFDAERTCEYELVHPRPQSLSEAKAYAKSFNGTQVSFRMTKGPPPGLESPSQDPAPPPVSPSPEPELQSTVDLLKYWWTKASEEERETFRQWMGSQP